MFARLVILIASLMGAATVGQAPEVVTQYEQRLGGAISELRSIIQQFDNDVTKNGLNRAEALRVYQNSSEPFLHDRGRSMEVALVRLENLTMQVSRFREMSEFYKPIYVFRQADQQLLEGVLGDYKMALPATAGGVLYASFGALIGLLFGGLLLKLSGLDTRRNKKRAA